MFKKFRKRRKKKQQHLVAETAGSSTSDTNSKPQWLQSKVQGIVYSLRAQQKEWRTNRSLVSRLHQYSPSPLRRLKRLFSTNSEPSLNDSDDGQRFSEDEWDAGTLRQEESHGDLGEVEILERLQSSSEEIGSSCNEQHGSADEKFHWVDSSTSLKLKEPNKDYYVLTPGIARQSDSSSVDLPGQFHHDEEKCETSSTMIQKDRDAAQNILDDTSRLKESVDGFLSNTKIQSLFKTKIIEEKCHPDLDLQDKSVCILNDNMPIVVENTDKNFDIDTHSFHSEIPVTKAGSICCDDVSDVRSPKNSDAQPSSNSDVRPPKNIMVPPSIVLQQPEQLTILELSPARPGISRLHLKAGATDVGARKSPVTVQEWVDSLPLELHRGEEEGEESQQQEPDEHLDLGLGAEAGLLFAVCPEVEVSSADHGSLCKKAKKEGFVREPSLQSDITSHTGSSMESYLESRRPDPEEVLLGLGFGGTGGGMQSDVCRIPRRFLQPSQQLFQVKGVAVDDFLQYQQDLIEKFETGFSGYRGLVGPSHTPSVIVAKIMEKLRDHERESSCRSSVASHLSVSTPASVPPPPAESKKFSHVARRVMKRTSVTSALSVLSPANREYLNSQGSKSPEIPRKRMIIGQRSFTFSGDGDLIEVESSPSSSPLCTSPVKQDRGLFKRLVHKDSTLSLATTASMTSIDSDSDTDDRDSEHEMLNKIARLPPTLPYIDSGPALPTTTATSTQTNFHHKVLDKRLSSTSLSSWEMENSAHPSELSSQISASSGPGSGSADEGPKPHSNFTALNFPRTKCESIDEDVTMEALMELPNVLQSSKMGVSIECVSDVELGTEAREELCDLSSRLKDDAVSSHSSPTAVQQPQMPTCLVSDQVCVLHRSKSTRRGSLKRQQHIVEDDDDNRIEEQNEDTSAMQEVFTTTVPQLNNENLLPLVPDVRGDSFEMEEILPLDEEKELLNITRARSESSGFLEGDGMENFPSSDCSPNNSSSFVADQSLGTLDSCQSTTNSSNVSESIRKMGVENNNLLPQNTGPGETKLTSQNEDAVTSVKENLKVDIRPRTCEKSSRKNSFSLGQLPTEESDIWSMLGIWGNDKYMKRLSLPVVCVHDEQGNVSRLSTSSLKSCVSDNVSSVTCTVRRVKSAPQSLCDMRELHSTIQTCGSFSNLFSFCSDESVVHISSRKGSVRCCGCHHHSNSNSRRHSASFDNLIVHHSEYAGARHSFQEGQPWNFKQAQEKHEPTRHAAKDLQELIHELTQAHVHTSTLRLAVEAYKKQLKVGSELKLDDLQECTEVQQELEVTRNICSRITAELRHITDLLDEEPTVRIANATCQMTELLREQTRLYEQLASRDNYVSTSLPPDVVSLHSSHRPQADVSPSNHCCCGKQLACIVREEHDRLEQLIKKNTDELTEIRHLLCELLARNNDSKLQTHKHS